MQPFLDDVAVVPAHRLLDVASALSDGASLMHARLRHLDPDDRDAILDLMAGQLSTIVHLWADLVRGVVAAADPDPAPPVRARRPSPARPAAPVRATHVSRRRSRARRVDREP